MSSSSSSSSSITPTTTTTTTTTSTSISAQTSSLTMDIIAWNVPEDSFFLYQRGILPASSFSNYSCLGRHATSPLVVTASTQLTFLSWTTIEARFTSLLKFSNTPNYCHYHIVNKHTTQASSTTIETTLKEFMNTMCTTFKHPPPVAVAFSKEEEGICLYIYTDKEDVSTRFPFLPKWKFVI